MYPRHTYRKQFLWPLTPASRIVILCVDNCVAVAAHLTSVGVVAQQCCACPRHNVCAVRVLTAMDNRSTSSEGRGAAGDRLTSVPSECEDYAAAVKLSTREQFSGCLGSSIHLSCIKELYQIEIKKELYQIKNIMKITLNCCTYVSLVDGRRPHGLLSPATGAEMHAPSRTAPLGSGNTEG